MSSARAGTDSPHADSKLRLALIGMAGTLAAALISASVSWFVSTRTLEVEQARAETEDTVQRATIFTDLMEQVGKKDQAGYAILALWKLYKDDRKLVVITALQSEDPQAIFVLRLLGLEDELDEYKQTVRNVLKNVTGKRRRELLTLYSEIDPEGVLALKVDEILSQDIDSFVSSVGFGELLELLQSRPAFRESLSAMYLEDDRMRDTVGHRFAFALALYVSGKTDPLDRMILEAKEEMELLGRLAPLLTAGEEFVSYEVRDQESFLDLSMRLMHWAGEDADRDSDFFNGLELFEQAVSKTIIMDAERHRVLQVLRDRFRRFPEDRFMRDRILRLVSELDRDEAEVLLYSAISCEDQSLSRMFVLTSDAGEGLLGEQNTNDFESLRLEGVAKLASRGQTCERWRT